MEQARATRRFRARVKTIDVRGRSVAVQAFGDRSAATFDAVVFGGSVAR